MPDVIVEFVRAIESNSPKDVLKWLKYFLFKPEINRVYNCFTNGFEQTPLQYAVIHGHLEVIDVLLKRGADTNYTGSNRQAPLHLAVINQKPGIENERMVQIITLLMEYGAVPTTETFRQAILDNNLKVLDLLLKNNSNLKLITKDAMEHTIRKNYLPSAQFLASRGFDFHDGEYLFEAVRARDPDICKFLVEQGSDIHYRDWTGRTPIELCNEWLRLKSADEVGKTQYEDLKGIYELLVAGGADDSRIKIIQEQEPIDDLFKDSLIACDYATVREMLDNGMHATNLEYLLAWMVYNNKYESVKFAKESGVFHRQIDRNCLNDLMVAVADDYHTTIDRLSILMGLGADVNACTFEVDRYFEEALKYDGFTCLDKARSDEIREFLIEKGAVGYDELFQRVGTKLWDRIHKSSWLLYY